MLPRKKLTFAIAWAASLALTTAAAPLRAGGQDDILKLIPADAWGFVIAKSLDNIDGKAAELKDALGLTFDTPVTPMPLGMLGIADDIDMKSPFALVMLDTQKFGDPQKATVLLVPAKDPKTLLEKLQAEPSEGEEGVSKCSVMGEPGFAAVKGKLVILASSEEAVAKVAKTKKSAGDSFAQARSTAMKKCDVFVSLSMAAVVSAHKPMFMPLLQMGMASSGMGNKDVEQFVKMFEEIESLDIAVSFDNKGFSLQLLAAARKDSDLAKLYGDEKNTKEPLLGVLPRHKYLFAMGATASNSEVKKKFSGDAPVSNLLKMLQLGELDQEAVKTLDKTMATMQESIKQYAVSVNLLGGEDGLFNLSLVAKTSDAQEFTDGVRKIYKTVGKVTDDEDFADALKHIKHEADAETIAGRKVDTLTIDVDAIAKASESDEEEIKRFKTLMGKECVLRFGAGDDKHFIISFGGGPKQFEAVCGAVKSSGDALSSDAGIQAAAGGLPSPRVGEAFVAVDQIFHAIKTAAKAMGEEEEFPFEMATINAPVAFSNNVQDDISRVDLLVPMKLIKAGKEAYDKFAEKSGGDDFDAEEGAEEGGKKKPAKKKSEEESSEEKADDSSEGDE